MRRGCRLHEACQSWLASVLRFCTMAARGGQLVRSESSYLREIFEGVSPPKLGGNEPLPTM